ncbi:hypothetical protein BaRGS_00025934 [Batillaria attramentaria]|uniref:acylglycerol lipase n=1 Tax=Batillaria attramentaria TaxID=370345 RepID=A0ABD0K785_9CAEN
MSARVSLSVLESIVDVPFLPVELLNPASLAVATAVTSLYIYFVYPHLLVQMYFRIAVRWSGMRLKKVTDEKGFTFVYGERGQASPDRPSVLLLHGFSADHFMWAPIVQNLPGNIHAVALDLPGHGLSSDPPKEEEIGFGSQLERIRQFLALANMEKRKFHVVGVSMGGALSGLFAARYPELVSAVTMTCPSMKTPVDGQMIALHRRAVEENGGRMTLESCPLLPQNGSDLKTMMEVVCYHRQFVPQQILQGAVDLRKQRNHFYLELLHELVSEHSRCALEAELHKISCPVQVVVHVSGVEVLKEKVPDLRRVDILACCGHAINLDQPRAFAEVVAQFWADAQSSSS